MPVTCRTFVATFALLFIAVASSPTSAAEPGSKFPTAAQIEVLPTDSKLTKILLIAGSNVYKPGEHEYVAGCAVLADLLRQLP